MLHRSHLIIISFSWWHRCHRGRWEQTGTALSRGPLTPQPACFPQVLIYEQPENLGHLSSSNFLPKQVTSQTQCLPHSDQSMCLLWLICSPAGSLLLCAGLASTERTSKPLFKTLRKLFPWILPPFSTFPLPDNIEIGKHSTYKSRLWSRV